MISGLLMLLALMIAVLMAVCFSNGLGEAAADPEGFLEEPDISVILVVAILLLTCGFIAVMIFYTVNIIRPLLLIERTIYEYAENGEYKEHTISPKEEKDNAFCRLYIQLNTMIAKSRNIAVREYSLQMLRKQAELAALQSQINPHFLYNTLDCIRGIAIDQGAENIEEMTKALSDMFRYSVSRKQMKVTLSDELANVHNYLTIQQYRFNNRLQIQENIDSDMRSCLVPKLTIQPIVENAVFYGLEPKIGSKNVRIRAYRTEKRLIINVEDNGMGMPLEKMRLLNDTLSTGMVIASEGSGTKIGLQNVNERIKMLYGPDYGLRVYSCQNLGTNVEITLPIEVMEAEGELSAEGV